ncbi:hypothetical protein P3342_004975 [Pyrenophora teres f. teres]|uniref:Uncharacterized protein n=1 Tax=Pyrenophora teres f. teres (strain 0-1) TaxID=861557 RepID=E3S381_PYRTT|nr:hypothetical protein PTT_19316 [Pyrenophora teres f. teres 0-1]EFQ87568.1 hypothetical protein PTT_16893 [Pyrenophora teres f. teres 0-1]KAK1913039.1 hypothetical protein P3342_004975 [Pyrenophora teres f. teres]
MHDFIFIIVLSVAITVSLVCLEFFITEETRNRLLGKIRTQSDEIRKLTLELRMLKQKMERLQKERDVASSCESVQHPDKKNTPDPSDIPDDWESVGEEFDFTREYFTLEKDARANLAFLHKHGYLHALKPDDMSQTRLVTSKFNHSWYVMEMVVEDVIIAGGEPAKQGLAYEALCDVVARAVECVLDQPRHRK